MSRSFLASRRSSWRTERVWRGVVARERGGELHGVEHGGQDVDTAVVALPRLLSGRGWRRQWR
jgi:hypothetical protein